MADRLSTTTRVDPAWEFCHAILPHVSRTFALTVPVLPDGLRDTVCCAYLLCRAADTIEDRPDLEPPLRQELFDRFLGIVDDPTNAALQAEFLERWPRLEDEPHQRLMLNTATLMHAYTSLPPEHREPLRDCVAEMVAGMKGCCDPPPVDGVVFVNHSLEEVERYCHYVAGTVGVMLSRLFAPSATPPDRAQWTEQGRRFGLGLQLTNILKDQGADLERGTAFLPPHERGPDGRLTDVALARYVRRTIEHLDQGMTYTLAIQSDEIRLFCLWALWMAPATLRAVGLAQQSGERTPKMARAEVMSIVDFTRRHVHDDAALSTEYTRLRTEALETLR